MDFRDRVALITGGSRGIGRGIALELGRRGARVVVNYHRNAEAAQAVVAALRADGGEATAVQADVSTYLESENLVKSAVEAFGRLDILINNAGITRDNLLMRISEADWDAVLDTNLKSTFNCSKAAIRPMMRNRYGRIINITSVSGVIGNPGQTNYSASKAGQIGFAKALAREVASRNITVNAIAAGYVETEIWATVPAEARQAMLNLIPLGRTGSVEEIAHAAAFLASEAAGYITGQVLVVDGGMTMA